MKNKWTYCMKCLQECQLFFFALLDTPKIYSKQPKDAKIFIHIHCNHDIQHTLFIKTKAEILYLLIKLHILKMIMESVITEKSTHRFPAGFSLNFFKMSNDLFR